ncbi:sugar transporter [Basfia succiniciproducens]|uniref:Probable sugar efflux transporter n=1 Tax=Basfia succiniciproducens TaxID=653940 RepID=A0A1G5CLZ0_9PAST|nr:sugar transporter [Basfia succiniciproducens]QIM68855.1 sugar transporter [Basfia succiniciproducens]SCY03364.1 MFS transporter, DHA1 family, L-arabinose/isopropyl-beta-D-thiogalactopyranoside export protein [Basfia succiniciproducens]
MLNRKLVNRVEYFRVIVMAFAAFVFNTTEFVPVALLSDIADSFQMPVSNTGLMITIYAWIVSLCSLPCMLMTAKLERRRLLISLFILFIASHILSAFAWNYEVLLIARAGVALTHSIFWSITAALTIRIAPKNKKTQALGLLALGSSLAMVLGLPLGRIIGQAFGWRTTFTLIGVFAALILILIVRLLPKIPSQNAGSLKSLPVLARRPMLITLYIFTILVISAHFTAYSYIEPFMIQISRVSANTATAVLLIFGVSGVFASVLFSRLYRIAPIKFLLSSVAILTLALICLYGVSGISGAIFALVFIWGVAISALSLAMQMKVLQLAPDATDVATAIYSGIYNIGIGGGALIGNQVMQHLGLANIGYVGAVLGAVSIIWFILMFLKFSRVPLNIVNQ